MFTTVLVLAGVAAGDNGLGPGAATAPLAADLGGRWVGTFRRPGQQVEAELKDGLLRLGPARTDFRMDYRYRFVARPGGGLEGAALLVQERPPHSRSAAVYRLERGRLLIFWRDRLTDFAVVLKPAARKP